jgi:hypothetical protein
LPKDNENFRFAFTEPVGPSEPAGFAAEQMIRCEECLRANPPTRINCLYCAASLPLTESSAQLRRPSLRPPEKHEQGYNIIILPNDQISIKPEALEEAANWLKLSRDDLERILSKETPLPVARTASEEEAKLIPERLNGLGLRAVSVSDDQLGRVDTSVTRIRALNFGAERVDAITSVAGDTAQFEWADVILLVPGRLVTRKVEVKESKSRKEEKELIDTSQFFDDEAVIDFYTSGSTQTWRICANSFDFSCLGLEKTLIANANIATLKKLIAERGSNSLTDDSYHSLRQTLEPVWGMVQETRSKGWRRERPGKYSLGATTVNSNESQFTRYSRLKFYLVNRRDAEGAEI